MTSNLRPFSVRRYRLAIARRLAGELSVPPPRPGLNLFADLAQVYGSREFPMTGVDIGANVGAWSHAFLSEFPNATLTAFEPNTALHDTWRAAMREFANRSHLTGMCVGDREGTVDLLLTTNSTISVVANPAGATDTLPVAITGKLGAQITALDTHRNANGPAMIDLLKIDTEGHELQVLAGMKQSLADKRVCAIECEVGVAPENRFHTPLQAVLDVLVPQGFRIFGFYDQTREWTADKPHLRRCNIGLINEDALAYRLRASRTPVR